MGGGHTDHDRWESLAVNHVLGGLDQADASEFRRHLVGCGQCQAQVAELRELAGTLEDAARDERNVLALRTRARREVAEDQETDEPPPSSTPRRIVVALVVIGLAVLGLAAHNVYLRIQQTALEDRVDQQAETIRGLGTGLPRVTTFQGNASGAVVADGERVAWSMTGLPVPTVDQRVIVWFVGPDGNRRAAVHGPESASEGAIAGLASDDDSSMLLVTLEDLDGSVLPNRPSDEVLAEADLSLVRQGTILRGDEPAGGLPEP